MGTDLGKTWRQNRQKRKYWVNKKSCSECIIINEHPKY
jgi:hypothetical protein